MGNFTPDSARALAGPGWLVERRVAAAEQFASAPLPTPSEEAWRYSRIDQLDLDRYRPAAADGDGHVPRPHGRAGRHRPCPERDGRRDRPRRHLRRQRAGGHRHRRPAGAAGGPRRLRRRQPGRLHAAERRLPDRRAVHLRPRRDGGRAPDRHRALGERRRRRLLPPHRRGHGGGLRSRGAGAVHLPGRRPPDGARSPSSWSATPPGCGSWACRTTAPASGRSPWCGPPSAGTPRCGRRRSPSAATTPGCAPRRCWPAPAPVRRWWPSTSPTSTRCSTSARCRTTTPPTPRPSCCSRARWRTRPTASTRASSA